MIRKRPILKVEPESEQVLDLAKLASFEVSSEDPRFPLEGLFGGGPGWRAAGEGPQTIRLNFDSPQNLSRITLVFEEHETARTQEFVLSWKPAGANDWRELRRQQFNFSPPGTTTEREEFQHIPGGVSGLEIRITPSIGGGGKASLARFLVE
jgi:hypothetical protein